MIVAVTGGTGFIGRKLVERHLAAGDRVRVLSRRQREHMPLAGHIEHFQGDLSTADSVVSRFADGADVLYHCAGELRRPEQMAALHVDGTARLIDAARGRIGRWVQLSSVGAYGRRCDGIVTETSPLAPRGPYEETKARSDELVQAASAAGAFEYVILRPSIVFGPDMPNHSLFQWTTMISRRAFFFIGAPGASANYIYVDNVVDALCRCATSTAAAGNVYNLSDWRTVEAFVASIAQSLARPAPHWRLPAVPLRYAARFLQRLPHMPLTEARVQALSTRARYPSDKIIQELGYTHTVSMEEGLHRMVARWRELQGGLHPTRLETMSR